MKPIIFYFVIIKLPYSMRAILKQIIIIVIVSLSLGLVRFFFLGDDNFDLIQVEEPKAENIGTCDIDPSKDFGKPQNTSLECLKYYFDLNEKLQSEEDSLALILDRKSEIIEKAIIVDSRPAEEYTASHIKGAVNIYAEKFEDLVYREAYDEPGVYRLEQDQKIWNEYPDKPLTINQIYIIYCNGGKCPHGESLSGKMYEEGFKKVFIYEEGLPAWEEKGYPVEGEGEDQTPFQLSQMYFLFLLILVVLGIVATSKWTNKNTYIVVGFRLILGMILIYASYSKIMDPVKFSATIDLYKATPLSINNLIALIVPWVELLIGFGLILNRSIKGSILISIGLFIVFIILLSQAYYRGFTLDCGCFANESSEKLSSTQLRGKMLVRIVEDIIYLFMSIYLYFIYVFKKNNNAN